MKAKLGFLIFTLAAVCALPAKSTPTISGDYLEVRSCDVYTGPCVANAEMNLGGKEGMLVWTVREGTWNGVRLDGLTVIAVVRTEATLGDVNYEPRRGKAVVIVDAKAGSEQRDALKHFARTMASKVINEIVDVKVARIESTVGQCKSGSCAKVKAGDLVEISTRCLGDKDHLCGNEENFYPPLTPVHHATSGFTEVARFNGKGLNATWTMTEKRSAYLGAFQM
jgi:hypothetical protein